jgi:hypothetical protein
VRLDLLESADCTASSCLIDFQRESGITAAPIAESGRLEARSLTGQINGQSIMKDRWIVVRHGNKVCYCQIKDVGPHFTDDFDHVFLGQLPRPSNNGASLDISPAAQQWLGMSGLDVCSWRFVDRPGPGPWLSRNNNLVALKK